MLEKLGLFALSVIVVVVVFMLVVSLLDRHPRDDHNDDEGV